MVKVGQCSPHAPTMAKEIMAVSLLRSVLPGSHATMMRGTLECPPLATRGAANPSDVSIQACPHTVRLPEGKGAA